MRLGRRTASVPQRLRPEVHEVERAGELDHGERGCRRLHRGGDAERRSHRPHGDAGVDPEGSRQGLTPTVHEGVLRHQCHVDARSDHDDERDGQERQELHRNIFTLH
jgi:hypothetical protein